MPQPAFSQNVDLFPAGTTTGTGVPVAVNHCQQISGHFKWSAGVSAGVAVIEIADSPSQAGTWAEVARSDVAGDAITGPADAFWTWPYPAGAVRSRMLTPAAGGSIQVTMNGLTGVF